MDFEFYWWLTEDYLNSGRLLQSNQSIDIKSNIFAILHNSRSIGVEEQFFFGGGDCIYIRIESKSIKYR